MILVYLPEVSLLSSLLESSKALLKEQALQGGQVRVGGGQRLTLAPRVCSHRPEPAFREDSFAA